MCVLQVASAGLQLYGASQQRKAQQAAAARAEQELARLLPVSREQFDYRLGESQVNSDGQISLGTGRYNQAANIEDTTRNTVRGERGAAFDEQLGARAQLENVFATEGTNLADATTAARTGALAVSEAERARQLQSMSAADALAAVYGSNVGAAPQATTRAARSAERLGFADAIMSDAFTVGPTEYADPRVRAELNKRSGARRAEQLSFAANGADLAAYGDAIGEDQRRGARYQEDISLLGDKAQISANALRDELRPFDVSRETSRQRFTALTDLAQFLAQGQVETSQNNRTQRAATEQDYGQRQVSSVDDWFTGLMEALQQEKAGNIGASTDYENRFAQLLRDKAGRITGSSPSGNFASALGSIGSVIASSLSGGGGGGGAIPMPLAPLSTGFSPMQLPSQSAFTNLANAFSLPPVRVHGG